MGNALQVMTDEKYRQYQIADAIDNMRGKILSDFIDDSYEIADQVFAIINDGNPDKFGRIQDVYDGYILRFATWLVNSPNTSVTIPMKRKLGIL